MEGVDGLARSIRAGDRAALARAITLVESGRVDDRARARALLERLDPHTGESHRVGISGLPGVGKSTLIETLGMELIAAGKRVAVLAVDPTSRVSGGSILGDKTRMARLSRESMAFIRPSPSGVVAGGVAPRSQEVILLCEAAGHDVVLVETVGVGQSETGVADMVDTFVALLLPGAGDELQAIKKGLVELADIVAVNKADGDRIAAARETAAEYGAALRYARAPYDGWRPRAVTVSARSGEGVDALWKLVCEHRTALDAAGRLEASRAEQRVRYMWRLAEEAVLARLHDGAAARARGAELEDAVREGRMSAAAAAQLLAGGGETDSH